MTSVRDGVRAVTGQSSPRSVQARQMFHDLMAIEPIVRREFVRDLNMRDLEQLLHVAKAEGGTPYCMYVDDPVGFVEDVLGESTWSKQREVLEALAIYRRVAVPSAFGTGKTHIAARAALWRALVFPIGTSLVVTTATRFRQVQRLLWPHIRSAVARANLPLVSDTTQLKAVSNNGDEVTVAYGFTAPPNDEAAWAGIHHPKLTIIVDEAGGISRVVGEALRGLLTGDDTKMLAIGNPPTDDEGGWFENLCEHDAKTHTIRISAYDAPLLSHEHTDWCRTCPPEVPRHRLAIHVTDPEWVEDALDNYGPDAPYIIAKVHARFPKGGAYRAIPSDWIEMATERPEPEADANYRKLTELSSEERDEWMVRMGSWVRLGVDVAADGGDELVISRIVGDLATIEHTSSGSVNSDSVKVAGVILEHIKRAQILRAKLGTRAPVRVKIDAIGVGWGVAGQLEAWRSEGVHEAEIVKVVVSEGTGRDDPKAVMRPYRKRDEMWVAARQLLQPRGVQPSAVRLRVPNKAAAQLAAPTYRTNSAGFTVIESKKSMKDRGLSSPDQGEALLLGWYEPMLKTHSKFDILA